jgi:hypothetical protein
MRFWPRRCTSEALCRRCISARHRLKLIHPRRLVATGFGPSRTRPFSTRSTLSAVRCFASCTCVRCAVTSLFRTFEPTDHSNPFSQPPDADLSPPQALLDSTVTLRSILSVYESSLLDSDGPEAEREREEEFSRILDAAVDPLLEMCRRMADLRVTRGAKTEEGGMEWDKAVFLVNCISYLEVCKRESEIVSAAATPSLTGARSRMFCSTSSIASALRRAASPACTTCSTATSSSSRTLTCGPFHLSGPTHSALI